MSTKGRRQARLLRLEEHVARCCPADDDGDRRTRLESLERLPTSALSELLDAMRRHHEQAAPTCPEDFHTPVPMDRLWPFLSAETREAIVASQRAVVAAGG